MIDDLDKSLEKLLKTYLPPALVSGVAISFAAPDNQFPPSTVKLPAVDLFLYDVRENRDLRDTTWEVERNGNMARRIPAPVRVDCSYLVTAWASGSVPNPAQDEHRLLGEVMRVLLRFSTLPEDVLQGSLVNQELPLPTSSLQSGKLQSLGEFWQAMGGKPKASLHYMVTLTVTPVEAGVAGPVVQEHIIKLELKES
ncbi:MAG: DUF4255 domain-containing protein [Anaerolineae bacterium]|nr:DUF4255 domain-containing protein [Anaerolineae bacterium]